MEKGILRTSVFGRFPLTLPIVMLAHDKWKIKGKKPEIFRKKSGKKPENNRNQENLNHSHERASCPACRFAHKRGSVNP